MNEQPKSIEATTREAMELIPVDARGVAYQNFLMVADRGKWMASGKASVPEFLKGNTPDCIAVVELAVGLGFQPVQVARLAYSVHGVMSFQSQLLHAVLNKSGILEGRVEFEFEGEGDERRCICTATFRGAKKPSTYATVPFAKIEPKNSPLWKTDPDQQMCYLALARWVKRWCPEVFLGCYTREELLDSEPSHFGPDNAKDVTEAANALHARLATAAAANGDAPAAGFHRDVVAQGLQETPDVAPEKPKDAAKPKGGGRAKAKTEKRAGEAPIEQEGQLAMLGQKEGGGR